ncbi:MAG: hypothetical protein R3A10_17870 [Caldilineaceae bacterium]
MTTPQTIETFGQVTNGHAHELTAPGAADAPWTPPEDVVLPECAPTCLTWTWPPCRWTN